GSRCVFPTFPIVFRPFKTLCFLNYALMIRQDYDITSSLRRGALHVRPFKTLCFLNYALMIRQDYDITSFLRRGALQFWYSEPGYETVGSKDLTCEDWMVNTHTDADLSTAIQNALQTLLLQIHAEIREEFRTSSRPSDAAPVDAKNWISHMEKIFDVMGCEDAFKTRLAVYKFEGNALAWWKAYKQAMGGDAWLITTSTETSTEFMQRFFRLAGFLGAAAGTEEEQAKNFQWGLRRSTLNHLMCMSYTDVAQVANAARNYEILHERDDDDTEQPNKRQRSGDRHQPTSQQSSHRSHVVIYS
nr:hypothetical protein [Tanacetum cinerariifolium]